MGHRDEPVRALPQDAFLAVRRVDLDTPWTAVRVGQGIADLQPAARLRGAVFREPLARLQQDSLPLGAAPAAHPVAAALPQERHPVEPVPSDVLGVSDAQLLPVPQSALPPDATELRVGVPLPVAQQVARAQRVRPEPQA